MGLPESECGSESAAEAGVGVVIPYAPFEPERALIGGISNGGKLAFLGGDDEYERSTVNINKMYTYALEPGG